MFHNFELATNYVKTLDVKQIVIKASGLAGGKGVCLPDTLEEATEALHQILVKNIYGVSGTRLYAKVYTMFLTLL